MKLRYKSMIFIDDTVGISTRKLRRVKREIFPTIREIENKLELPKRAVIDWTIRIERENGRFDDDVVYIVSVHWYEIRRPRDDNGKNRTHIFAFRDSGLCEYVDCPHAFCVSQSASPGDVSRIIDSFVKEINPL
jgi:hypothetical protein